MKQTPEEIKAYLGKENVVEGKITFQGVFHLDGTFEGEICGGGTLILGDTAIVKGKLGINTLIVKGQVEGEICAAGRMEIHSTGKVYGSIATPVLVINEGGVLEGQCKMNGKIERPTEGGREDE